jgi:hypothetical protein
MSDIAIPRYALPRTSELIRYEDSARDLSPLTHNLCVIRPTENSSQLDCPDERGTCLWLACVQPRQLLFFLVFFLPYASDGYSVGIVGLFVRHAQIELLARGGVEPKPKVGTTRMDSRQTATGALANIARTLRKEFLRPAQCCRDLCGERQRGCWSPVKRLTICSITASALANVSSFVSGKIGCGMKTIS